MRVKVSLHETPGGSQALVTIEGDPKDVGEILMCLVTNHNGLVAVAEEVDRDK